MFDQMDHMTKETSMPVRRRKGSTLRGILAWHNRKRRLVNFVKWCFFEYLNSGKNWDEIVEEYVRAHPLE